MTRSALIGVVLVSGLAILAGCSIDPNLGHGGKVIGPDDRPLAGATVDAYEVLDDPVEGGVLRDLGRSQTTGADGAFLFPPRSVAARTVFVIARKPPLAMAWGDWLTGPGHAITLKLGEPAALAGAVVDEKGRPVAAAEVFPYFRVRVDMPMEHELDDLPPPDWPMPAGRGR